MKTKRQRVDPIVDYELERRLDASVRRAEGPRRNYQAEIDSLRAEVDRLRTLELKVRRAFIGWSSDGESADLMMAEVASALGEAGTQ